MEVTATVGIKGHRKRKGECARNGNSIYLQDELGCASNP